MPSVYVPPEGGPSDEPLIMLFQKPEWHQAVKDGEAADQKEARKAEARRQAARDDHAALRWDRARHGEQPHTLQEAFAAHAAAADAADALEAKTGVVPTITATGPVVPAAAGPKPPPEDPVEVARRRVRDAKRKRGWRW